MLAVKRQATASAHKPQTRPQPCSAFVSLVHESLEREPFRGDLTRSVAGTPSSCLVPPGTLVRLQQSPLDNIFGKQVSAPVVPAVLLRLGGLATVLVQLKRPLLYTPQQQLRDPSLTSTARRVLTAAQSGTIIAMASQNPPTPVKVPAGAANYTPATLDPDLRSQLNMLLIKEGIVFK